MYLWNVALKLVFCTTPTVLLTIHAKKRIAMSVIVNEIESGIGQVILQYHG